MKTFTLSKLEIGKLKSGIRQVGFIDALLVEGMSDEKSQEFVDRTDLQKLFKAIMACGDCPLVEDIANLLLFERIPLDITCVESGKVIIKANQKITKPMIKKWVKKYRQTWECDPSPINNKLKQVFAKYE